MYKTDNGLGYIAQELIEKLLFGIAFLTMVYMGSSTTIASEQDELQEQSFQLGLLVEEVSGGMAGLEIESSKKLTQEQVETIIKEHEARKWGRIRREGVSEEAFAEDIVASKKLMEAQDAEKEAKRALSSAKSVAKKEAKVINGKSVGEAEAELHAAMKRLEAASLLRKRREAEYERRKQEGIAHSDYQCLIS